MNYCKKRFIVSRFGRAIQIVQVYQKLKRALENNKLLLSSEMMHTPYGSTLAWKRKDQLTKGHSYVLISSAKFK